MLDTQLRADALGARTKMLADILSISAEVGEIELVTAQRLDSSIEVSGDVDGVSRLRRGVERCEAHPRPRRAGIRKDPRIRCVAYRVEQGPSHGTVVSVIPTRATPTVAVIDRQDHFGLVPTNRCGQVTSQFEICLDKPVGMIEELHDRDADRCAAAPLLCSRAGPTSAGGMVEIPASPRVTNT